VHLCDLARQRNIEPLRVGGSGFPDTAKPSSGRMDIPADLVLRVLDVPESTYYD
jgi:hypothetical protein